MAKLTNIRERVQQPYRDSLLRTAGLQANVLPGAQVNLFTNGRDTTPAATNQPNGSTLASDSSMIILALRCFLWFRNSRIRTEDGEGVITQNGELGAFPNGAGEPAEGNALGDTFDVWRLYWMCNEGILWTFGAGDKPSIQKMPSAYFPYGGSLTADIGGNTNFVFANLGDATHQSILKLARAILLVPRQAINCLAELQNFLPGTNGQDFQVTQDGRNMLSVLDNLNAVDAIQKVVSFTFDGLLSRDVQ